MSQRAQLEDKYTLTCKKCGHEEIVPDRKPRQKWLKDCARCAKVAKRVYVVHVTIQTYEDEDARALAEPIGEIEQEAACTSYEHALKVMSKALERIDPSPDCWVRTV